MKFIVFIIFLISSFLSVFAQEHVPLCHFDNKIKILDIGNIRTQNFDCGFTNNERAYREIEKIMKLAGFPMNFTICKTENISNAYAALDSEGVRFIVYDDKFLKSFDTDTLRLETVTALAHEIEHHLSGHTLALINYTYRTNSLKYCDIKSKFYDKVKCENEKLIFLKESREEELEADRFAGFIMYKYGASLSQISSLYIKMTSNYNDSLSDHPNLDKRLAAIKSGFELAELYKDANITYIDLEKIKGRKIEIDIHDSSIIIRNIIVEKIRNSIQQASIYVTQNMNGQQLDSYSGGPIINPGVIAQYIGVNNNSFSIDNQTEYFSLANYFIGLRYDERVKFYPQPAIHIKNGILKIIVFGVQDKAKVVYHAPYKLDKISLEEIKVIFIEIYRDGIRKEIEQYYPSSSLAK